MIRVRVLFFASLREKAGLEAVDMELDAGSRVADFRQQLNARFPNLPHGRANMLVAINQQYAFDDEVIPEAAVLAVFPPVSGGSLPEVFSVTTAEVDLNQLVAAITTPDTGAACVFTGTVRAKTAGAQPHETIRLEYEAYTPMAEAKMRQVAAEIRERWPLVEGIAIVQRLGQLQPGTPTVVIACSAGHRDSGVFEAARYGIDRLKEIVPIWKKEIGPGGDTWVEGEYVPGAGD